MREALHVMISTQNQPQPVHAEIVLQGMLSMLAHRQVHAVWTLLRSMRKMLVLRGEDDPWRGIYNCILAIVNQEVRTKFPGGAQLANLTPIALAPGGRAVKEKKAREVISLL